MKIDKLITFLLYVSFLPLIASCGDNDDFSGTDNYVTSFVVQKGGVGYAATIVGNNINITVPTNVSLNGATAVCQTSEYATVSPDPTTITDWDSAQKIIVTSQNNTVRTYNYTVTKSDISDKGVVVLRTQAEVKAFAEKNVAILDGSLMIGENTATDVTDSIKDLSALSSLKQITGTLSINNSFAGKSLKGLNNLTRVSNIYIGTSTAASGIDSIDVELPQLTTASEIIINYHKAKSISLPKLDNVYSLSINSNSVSNITLSALRQVYGNMTLTGSSKKINSIEMNTLATINGTLSISQFSELTKLSMTGLKTVGNQMIITSMAKLANIDTGIESVGGSLTISSLPKYTTVAFGKLKSAGTIYYKGDYSDRPVTAFDLNSLETVAKDINISYTSITQLNIPKLKTLGGTFKIQNSENIASITMPNLTSCPTLYLSDIYKLESIDLSGISNMNQLDLISPYILKTVKMPKSVTNIDLNGGSRSTVMPEFEGLEKITGKFTMSNYEKLAVATIAHIKEIGQYSQLSGSITSLSFPDLEKIGTFEVALYHLNTLIAPKLTTANNFDWEFFYTETKVDLSSLTTITGTLKFWGGNGSWNANNCKLTNINFFSSLKKIGSVDIGWCGSLTDFSGLKNALTSLSATTWKVEGCKYNPTYQDMVDGKTSSATMKTYRNIRR